MKIKYYGVIVGALSLLFLTGCGGSGNKLSCTADYEENGHKYSAEIVAELDSEEKVKNVDAIYTFNSSDEADQFYSSYQMMINFAKQFAEEDQEIPEIDIKKDGKKITISNFAALESMNSDETEESPIGMKKEEFIKKIESSTEDDVKWTCK